MSPTGEVTLPELAAALIAVFEGCRLTAYRDSGGVLTIGIGHTRGVVEGQTISQGQAVQLFLEDQAPLLELVKGLPLLEAAALVSFGFNCGQGALQLVLAGHDVVSNPKHTTDRHGTVLSGLVARRRLEELLILISMSQERKTAS
jgi:lysozyme